MKCSMQKELRIFGTLACGLVLLLAGSVQAQTTAFTYQGKLTDAGNPANGNYDLQFKLFDTLAVGTGAQQGATLVRDPVVVSAGVFTVTLDFGASVFTGADRYLEIGVRPAGSANPYTVLAPRQPLTSTPYAIRTLAATMADSLSAACVGCVTSTQIGSLPASSGNYVQNSTTQQASSNFNISGDGTAGGTLSSNIVNATAQYNLGGSRILSKPGANNLFAGAGAGAGHTTSQRNTLLGAETGMSQTTAVGNTFVGYRAGKQNTASFNTFIGDQAGGTNTSGTSNTFAGFGAGSLSAGSDNAFFGFAAGQFNQAGGANAIFGAGAGTFTTGGSNNAFFGFNAGQNNGLGSNNAFFGFQAGLNSTGISNSFIGASAGSNTSTGEFNTFLGTSAGFSNTTGANNTFLGSVAGLNNVNGASNTALGSGAGFLVDNLNFATAVGANSFASASNRIQLGRFGSDTVAIGLLAAASATHVCLTEANVLATCSSSRRYKENVQPLGAGLGLIQRLRPVTFDWRGRAEHDLGLIAEEVAAVAPLLNTYNQHGQLEGVKYEQLTVVLINAVKEQQAQIAALRARLRVVERVLRKQTSAARRR